MRVRRFEYQSKDTPLLKKDIIFRMLFVLLFTIAFIWQIVFMFRDYATHNLTTTHGIVGSCVLIISLLFDIVAFVYAYRSINILQKIKIHGHAVKMITVLSDNRKGSFLKLYNLITKLIAIVMSLALVSGLTYGILEYVYYSTISFYLPILFFVAVSGFNTVYHVTAEIRTIKEVQEYYSVL